MKSFAVALALLVAPMAQAQQIGSSSHNFGLGLAVGYPTGLTAKYYLSRKGGHALEGTVATASYDFNNRGGAYFHLNYMWHPDTLIDEPDFSMPWHVGIGGLVWSRYWGYVGRNDVWYGQTAFGVRAPIGLDFNLKKVPLQFFLDAAANVYLSPATWVDIGGSLGGRYYF